MPAKSPTLSSPTSGASHTTSTSSSIPSRKGLCALLTHWATYYIGRSWHAAARGPYTFDCWGSFLAIQPDHFGRDLPEIPVNANDLRTVMTTFPATTPELQRWVAVVQPAESDAVPLPQFTHPVHVGVWLTVDGEFEGCPRRKPRRNKSD
jgi:hypothetical protein